MDRPITKEVVKVGAVAALFGAGTVLGGPVGGALGAVAGEMLAGVVERSVDQGFTTTRNLFLGEQGLLNPDLQVAMRKSYACAVNRLERTWEQGRGVEWRVAPG